MNLEHWMKVVDLARNLTSPKALDLYGLSSRRGLRGPLTLFAAGALVGAAACLIAPTKLGNGLRAYVTAQCEGLTKVFSAGETAGSKAQRGAVPGPRCAPVAAHDV